MINYNTFLILPIFKINKFSQNDIFNQKNFISRSSETRSLVQALDASIVFEKIINISIPKSSLLINNTVANEIKNNFDLSLVDLIIFDCSLSPIQQRNLERVLQKKIIDRTQLIIEIFGLRAKTKEGIISNKEILAASDAFFPFVDGIEKLVQNKVSAIIQPSGSIKDKEIINFANKTGTILVFSKTRHFKH